MKLEDEIKSSFRNEYQKARLNIYFTHNYLSQQTHNMMKTQGLTPQQFNILRILRGQKGNAVSIGLIKDRMIDKNSDVSRILERLVKKGLIERTENSIDRRQKDVIISSEGLKVLSSTDELEAELDNQLSALTKTEVKTLNDLLDKVRES